MPIHDWTRVDAGLFHAFHQQWTVTLANALNDGLLPPDYAALPEQRATGLIPDVLTVRVPGRAGPAGGGTAVADARPRAHTVQAAAAGYLGRANRLTVRTVGGEIVAVVEIVSPGNKSSRTAVKAFVDKAADFIRRGIHLVVLDLFPYGPRDPDGLHAAIWADLGEPPDPRPADKPLTAAAYDAGDELTAYVEPLAVGDELPDLPLFLRAGWYVPCPLAVSYATAWRHFPNAFKPLLGPPA